MSQGTTGKEKASRIPLDYHQRADSLIRTRLQLSLVAVFLALAFVCWGFLGLSGATQHTHGPVAAVHSTWEAQCAACHQDFAPIRSDAAFAAWHWPGESHTWGHAADAKCQACHAGPAHVAREKADEVASCASCHQEHQGAQASLVRMADQHCTRCHAQLPNHTASREREIPFVPFASTITSWQADHPDFRSLKRDPGTIKFTHGRHMALGLRSAPDDRVQMKLADLSPEDRKRYRQPGQNDTDLIQLDCAQCHASDTSSTASSLPSSGEYMLPISYEQHCRACHPLTVDPQQPTELLPHGLMPDRIRRDLMGRLGQTLIEQAPQEWKELLRPVPARQGEQPPRTQLDLLTQRVLKAEQHVRQACTKCHELAPPTTSPPALPESLAPAELAALLPPVQAPAVPQVWLKHARFDHAAHRAYDCRLCHEQAWTSKTNQDVLIAGRKVCLDCHTPATVSPKAHFGGARHDCAECHRYHAADRPPHGRGSPLRDALHKAATAGRGEAP